MAEYGSQKAIPHLSNAAWMLTVEKIEQTPVLIKALSLQDSVKPDGRQYKTTVGSKIVAKSQTWLIVKIH